MGVTQAVDLNHKRHSQRKLEIMGIKNILLLLQLMKPKPEQAPEEGEAVENPQNKESTNEIDIKTTVDPENG